jgi:DNA-binding response OmpR family regulator
MTNTTTKKTILTIDDSPEVLNVVKNLLSKDYTVKGAINGPTGLKIAESQSPDLILLDIMMPEMDGYEVCRQLKANPKTTNIPIIFLTGQDTLMEEAKGLMVGAADFLLKPIEPRLLSIRINLQLAQVKRWKEREAVLLEQISRLEKAAK